MKKIYTLIAIAGISATLSAQSIDNSNHSFIYAVVGVPYKISSNLPLQVFFTCKR